jgi:hypothetical protein
MLVFPFIEVALDRNASSTAESFELERPSTALEKLIPCEDHQKRDCQPQRNAWIKHGAEEDQQRSKETDDSFCSLVHNIASYSSIPSPHHNRWWYQGGHSASVFAHSFHTNYQFASPSVAFLIVISLCNSYQTLALHWNGASWKIVPSPNMTPADSFLNGVTVLSARDVWMVGIAGTVRTDTALTLIEHWDGNSWRIVVSPNVEMGNDILWAVARVPGTHNAWAVGSHSGPTYRTLTKYNG